MMTPQPHNLTLLRRDNGYRFTEASDLLLQQIRDVINAAELPTMDIWERVFDATNQYVGLKTIENLMNGKTKRPHLRTCELILAGLGLELTVR